MKIDLNNLFIFELANNHQGDLAHGIKIIRELGSIAQKEQIKAAIKFQFRDLDRFIHPDHISNSTNKHIPRFLSTRLTLEQFEILTEEAKKFGMFVAATPFDEKSVQDLIRLNIDIVKVASCSAADYPLLKEIQKLGKPTIASTAGLNFEQLDDLVNLLDNPNIPFALMHCVALYPTPANKLELQQISVLKKRFPNLVIGFSTHEEPTNLDAIKMAYALGARVFEKHVALPHSSGPPNSYSATPEQIIDWIHSYKEAQASCGSDLREHSTNELNSLRSLQRGIFLNRAIKKGELIKREDVFFAMPISGDKYMCSGEWNNTLYADHDYLPNEALTTDVLKISKWINSIKDKLLSMLAHQVEFNPKSAPIEISHHYGMDSFDQFGAIVFSHLDEAKLRKIIAVFPGQEHPKHLHPNKNETYRVIFGDLSVELNGKWHSLLAGKTLLIPKNLEHKFRSVGGAIFEEISSMDDETIYADSFITALPRNARKVITHLHN